MYLTVPVKTVPAFAGSLPSQGSAFAGQAMRAAIVAVSMNRICIVVPSCSL